MVYITLIPSPKTAKDIASILQRHKLQHRELMRDKKKVWENVNDRNNNFFMFCANATLLLFRR